jgi:hypothetical protein
MLVDVDRESKAIQWGKDVARIREHSHAKK